MKAKTFSFKSIYQTVNVKGKTSPATESVKIQSVLYEDTLRMKRIIISISAKKYEGE